MHQQLFDVLEATLLDVCRAALEKHAGEQFYCIALYTNGEYNYLIDSFCTTEGLETVAKKYLEDTNWQDRWGTLDVAMQKLKWSPVDSPYHEEFYGLFDRVNETIDSIWEATDSDSDDEYINTCKEIHETSIAALVKVRDSGLFDKDQVLFNLLKGDQGDEERILNAEAVNSETVLAWFPKEFGIDDDELKKIREKGLDW